MGGVSLYQIKLYYVFVFLSFIYLLFKFKNNKFSLFIVLLFYNGFFSFIGKDVQNIYRIVLTIITLYYLDQTKSLYPKKNNLFSTLGFVFFSVLFFYSSYLNNDYFFIVFSQYSRYFVLFSLFIIFYKYRYNIK